MRTGGVRSAAQRTPVTGRARAPCSGRTRPRVPLDDEAGPRLRVAHYAQILAYFGKPHGAAPYTCAGGTRAGPRVRRRERRTAGVA